MRAAVIIEGESFGSIDLPPFFKGACLYEPEGAHFFCPDCGRIWASIQVTKGRQNVFTTRCSAHHCSFFDPGGSLWLPLHEELTDAFNERMLIREFLLHLKLAEAAEVDLGFELPLHELGEHGHQEDLRAG